jgi:hypothetical protein
MSHATASAKRRLIRFPGDPLDFALLDFGPDDRPFSPQQVALLVEEAPMGGCSLAVSAGGEQLVEGRGCRVKVGRMEPVRAEVRWARALDDRITRVGLQFLE